MQILVDVTQLGNPVGAKDTTLFKKTKIVTVCFADMRLMEGLEVGVDLPDKQNGQTDLSPSSVFFGCVLHW